MSGWTCATLRRIRKRKQGIARQREIYESLFHFENKTEEQALEMADACLSLIECGIFTQRQLERVRMLLNRMPVERDKAIDLRYHEILRRVTAIEAVVSGEPSDEREPE